MRCKVASLLPTSSYIFHTEREFILSLNFIALIKLVGAREQEALQHQ